MKERGAPEEWSRNRTKRITKKGMKRLLTFALADILNHPDGKRKPRAVKPGALLVEAEGVEPSC